MSSPLEFDLNVLFKAFETTLKDVVKGKRLSASKMTALTEIALKSMEVRLQCHLASIFD